MELTSEKSCCSAGKNQVDEQEELRSTGGNCQGDDRQESCSSVGNCQADEQTVITQLSRTYHVTEHALFTWLITHISRE